MKKSLTIGIVTAGIISGLALILAAAFFVSYTINKSVLRELRLVSETGLNDNVNIMLKRSENWEKFIESAPVSQENMFIIDGSTATIPITAEMLRQFYGFSDERINNNELVQHSTTHYAYEALIFGYTRNSTNKLTRLILVTPPSDEEAKMAADQGVELDISPIARDGFVFITHKNNPVDNLTIQQVRDIYSGKITNWKEVGGENRIIKAYQREKNSGSQTAMEQLVMGDTQLMPPKTESFETGMGGLVKSVAEYENGPSSIGYTYYYYINSLYKNDNIKVINIDGFAPSNENLISGDYPFTTNYYAIIREDEPEYSPAYILRDFLVSGDGQRLVEMAGYCPMH